MRVETGVVRLVRSYCPNSTYINGASDIPVLRSVSQIRFGVGHEARSPPPILLSNTEGLTMNSKNEGTKESSSKKPLIPKVIGVDAGTLTLICVVLLLVPLLFVGFFSL